MPGNGRLDPALRRVVTENPDSVVGILIRTAAAPTTAELTALARAGVTVGAVAGTIVTGRARARDAARAAGLPFVVYIELAAVLRPTDR